MTSIRSRWTMHRNVVKRHRKMGVKIGNPCCTIVTGGLEPCCFCNDPNCSDRWPITCSRPLSLWRYVLFGHCGKHERRSA